MSRIPEIRAKYGEGIGVEVFYRFPELYDDQRTYLEADVAVGATTLSCSGQNFSVGQYIVIGNPGNVKTELIQIHTSTPPTSTVITLQTATQFAHNRGDIVRFIPYNQIVPEQSTDGTNYVVQTTVGIRTDSYETYNQFPNALETYYYRYRFFNSTTGLYSAYSNITVASGFAENTIFAVKDKALRELGEQRSILINETFLNNAIYQARRALDQDVRIFRCSFRRKDDIQIGQVISGTYRVAAPTDLRDRNTHKNILMLRVGRQNYPVIYQDDQRFKQNYLNVGHTTLASAASSGATTLTLTSSADFDSSGTIKVAGSGVGVTQTTITYTSNNRATGVLSGVSGVPAAGLASGSDVWQNATFGLPRGYTIAGGYIYFDLPFSDTYDGQGIKMDYYYTLPTVTNDSDTFDEPFYDIYVPWVKWKIKYLKTNGRIDRKTDPDYQDWEEGALRNIMQETPGQRINFIPDVTGFLSSSE